MDANEAISQVEKIAAQRHIVNAAAAHWAELEETLGGTHPDTIAAADETARQRGVWGQMRRDFERDDTT